MRNRKNHKKKRINCLSANYIVTTSAKIREGGKALGQPTRPLKHSDFYQCKHDATAAVAELQGSEHSRAQDGVVYMFAERIREGEREREMGRWREKPRTSFQPVLQGCCGMFLQRRMRVIRLKLRAAASSLEPRVSW